MSFYSIRKKELTDIADAIRAKTGKSDGMSIEDMPKEIGEIITGRVPPCVVSVEHQLPNNVDVMVNISASVSVEDGGRYYPYALYNGIKLPRIPENVLASYPYAWIRVDTNTGYYELFLAAGKWYGWNNGSGTKITVFGHEDSNNIKWYRIATASAESAEKWTYYQDYSANNFGVEAPRTVLWSNHDIPNGSADATEIYFNGSEPVLTD